MLSIILPFKNAASWIGETIDSILDQEYTNWELICIDDFSEDNSSTLIMEYYTIDKRIQLIRNKKSGIIPALQLGLKYSAGTYITRMDADDIMPSGRLNHMVSTMKVAPPKTIVTGKVKYFSGSQVSDGYLKYERWLNDRIDNNDHFAQIYRECVIASPNWLARKDELLEYSIFEQLNYPEDYDMVFRWFSNGFTIHGLNETTLHWREHPQRTSRNSDVYDQESFFNLKLRWFIHLIDLKDKCIAILGAGQKGKIVAQFFQEKGIDFDWYDLNYSNFNSPIFGKTILNPEQLEADITLTCIYPEKLDNLNAYLREHGLAPGKNAWYL